MMIYEHLLLLDSNMGLEEILEQACKDKAIPGVVLVADGPGQSFLAFHVFPPGALCHVS